MPILLVLALVAALARPVAAQSPLERVIGPDEAGDAIVMTRVEPMVIGKIAKAAGVPMGLELAPGNAARFTSKNPKRLTGLTVRAALDLIAGIDSRYEWRDMNGVIVLRTPDAWNRANHPLHLPIQHVVLRDVRARNALSVVAAFLGGPQYANTQLGDTKRFSLQVDDGTVLDLLNAAVSAHGELAWSFETKRVDNKISIFPFMVSLYSGGFGNGCGVPGTAPESPVDLARYVDPPVVARGGSSAALDRIVGVGPNELPLVVHGSSQSGVLDLANASRVPMGIEFLPPARYFRVPDIPATGRTLREVLDAMISVDPRYEWRELDGVIVIRPAAAWNDPRSLLFRVVEPVHLIDIPPNQAIQRIAREVGYPYPITGVSGKPLSLDLPQGTVLDLANAIVRAHGELTWALGAEPPLDGAAAGYSHTLTFSVMGGTGLGFGAR